MEMELLIDNAQLDVIQTSGVETYLGNIAVYAGDAFKPARDGAGGEERQNQQVNIKQLKKFYITTRNR